ncbi:MAG: hypothetical protein P1T08_12745 [Acidimicrobiia bacterium]|nr:hypothetical protein [Acidimicrobiia bacterium]
MAATATIKTRAIQLESLPAVIDRLINSVLLTEGVVDVAGLSFKVAQNLGTDMNVKVGSGTAYDRAVVAGDLAGQGVYVIEHQNASQVLAVPASDPTNPRKDIVIARIYDDTFDSSGNSYADVELIQGTPAAAPTAPTLPDGALLLATVDVAAATTAIVNGNITDNRYEAPIRGEHVQTVQFTSSGTFTKADYPWLKKVRVRVQGGGGAGGGAAITAAGQFAAGGGGGGGGYADTATAASALSASETVTVGAGGVGSAGATGGAGGASSFGTLAIASGGGGGSSGPSLVGPAATLGGAGGQGSAGDFQTAGGGGGFSVFGFSQLLKSGIGGSSLLGDTGTGQSQQISSNGAVASGYGAGGSGGANLASQGTAKAGGAGGQGIVIVDLYA